MCCLLQRLLIYSPFSSFRNKGRGGCFFYNSMFEKVSIVMCTYNGAAFLPQQLDSLLGQTYPLHEIIVQDDGSTDETWAILQQYAQVHSILKPYRNAGVKGINGNFFSALRRATGDFIAISDQDDVWESTKIAKQVESIGRSLLCGGFSKPFSQDGFPVKWDSRRPCLHALRLAFISEIPGHVQFLHRDLLDFLPALGAYPYLYDWQLQFIASLAQSLVFTDEVLVNFRRHSLAATATKPVSNKGGEARNTFFFLLKNYTALHDFAAVRFSHVIRLIQELQQKDPRFKTPSAELTLQMARLYVGKGWWNYLKLTVFCLRHHEHLFHAPEPKKWKSVLRAAYFPLYSLNYYRGIIK